MSTNAHVIEQLEDGSYRGIYNHWDGYPDHLGRMLVDHFNTAALAKQLIDLGHCSSISENLNDTVAYARDRDEDYDDNCPIAADTLDELEETIGGFYEYTYIFRDGTWWVTWDGKEITVAQALEELDDEE